MRSEHCGCQARVPNISVIFLAKHISYSIGMSLQYIKRHLDEFCDVRLSILSYLPLISSVQEHKTRAIREWAAVIWDLTGVEICLYCRIQICMQINNQRSCI